MSVLFKDLNHMNILTILIILSIAFSMSYSNIKAYIRSIQDENVSGIKIKRPAPSKKAIKNIQEEIDELDELINRLNADFLSGDKMAMSNFDERLAEVKKRYLELYLRIESLLTQKKILKEKKIDVTPLAKSQEKLAEFKVIIDLLVEEKNSKEQEKQGQSLHILTIVETIFLPLGVITGYFGMNFQSMGNDLGDKPFGIYSIKYGQLFVFLLFFLSILFIVLGFRYLFGSQEGFGSMEDLNNLQRHYHEILIPDDIPAEIKYRVHPWEKNHAQQFPFRSM